MAVGSTSRARPASAARSACTCRGRRASRPPRRPGLGKGSLLKRRAPVIGGSRRDTSTTINAPGFDDPAGQPVHGARPAVPRSAAGGGLRRRGSGDLSLWLHRPGFRLLVEDDPSLPKRPLEHSPRPDDTPDALLVRKPDADARRSDPFLGGDCARVPCRQRRGSLGVLRPALGVHCELAAEVLGRRVRHVRALPGHSLDRDRGGRVHLPALRTRGPLHGPARQEPRKLGLLGRPLAVPLGGHALQVLLFRPAARRGPRASDGHRGATAQGRAPALERRRIPGPRRADGGLPDRDGRKLEGEGDGHGPGVAQERGAGRHALERCAGPEGERPRSALGPGILQGQDLRGEKIQLSRVAARLRSHGRHGPLPAAARADTDRLGPPRPGALRSRAQRPLAASPDLVCARMRCLLGPGPRGNAVLRGPVRARAGAPRASGYGLGRRAPALALGFYSPVFFALTLLNDPYEAGYWLPRLVLPALVVFFSLGFAALDFLYQSLARWRGAPRAFLNVFAGYTLVACLLFVGFLT